MALWAGEGVIVALGDSTGVDMLVGFVISLLSAHKGLTSFRCSRYGFGAHQKRW